MSHHSFTNVDNAVLTELSQSAIVGFVRSLGVNLPAHNIMLNAICPGIVKTSIGTGDFYEQVEREGLLVPMKAILNAFESLMGADSTSGEAIEVLSGDAGARIKERPPYTNDKCRESVEMTNARSKAAAAAPK